MSNITLKNIAELLNREFDSHLEPINSRLTAIEATLDVHTKALDELITEKKERKDEKAVNAYRFERLEKWATLAGKKLGIKLEL